ncbi:MAG: hypothetical protein RLY35_1878 [Bacteroidota bacterium]|jgi:hypothetical protein
MKKLIIATILLCPLLGHAQNLKTLSNKANQAVQSNNKIPAFSEKEAADALKEALTKGATLGADIVSKTDGYFGNPKIKIPLPPDAQAKEQKLKAIGLEKEVDQAVLSINRAAEDAGVKAKEIFVRAIANMTVSDAISIVKGELNAGTNYLKKQTQSALYADFKPVIEESLKKVGATKHYEAIVTQYNKIPGVTKLNPNLSDFVTQKAIDGLFIMVEQEEYNIRKNPVARTTALLKKVFES